MKKNWDPVLYKKTATKQFQLGLAILEQINFQGNEHVLDVGCGDGRLTAYIATQLVSKGKVLGIDASEAMIQSANATYEKTEFPNLDFQILNIEELKLKQRFEIIVSFNALHWVKNQIVALRNIYNALIKGGRAVILIHPRIEHIWGPMERVSASKKWQPYFKNFKHAHCFYDIDGYELLIKEAGLTIDSIQSQSYMLKFPTKQDYINVQKSFCPYPDQIPAERREEFFADVADDFEKFTAKDDEGNLLCPGRDIEAFTHRA